MFKVVLKGTLDFGEMCIDRFSEASDESGAVLANSINSSFGFDDWGLEMSQFVEFIAHTLDRVGLMTLVINKQANEAEKGFPLAVWLNANVGGILIVIPAANNIDYALSFNH